MALMHVNFFSDALRMAVSADVIIPEQSKSLIGMDTVAGSTYKTLYLLHGLSDDHTIWQRRTNIERYVAGRNMAVVMPTVFRNWYCDTATGERYMTYISEELPAVMRSFFRGMSDKREDNFVAGLSMGGYGAMKVALTNPERFLGAASFSGVLDVVKLYDRREINRKEYENVFGDPAKVKGSLNDIEFLARRAAASGKPLPSLYLWCGTEDDLLSHTRGAKEYFDELGFRTDYHESAGNHSWGYWDEQIRHALDYFDTLS